jgi:feruloyl-CoA synthase
VPGGNRDQLAAEDELGAGITRIERLLVMARPADLDAGEITDKGNVNQRQVLANGAAVVELLYTEPVLAGLVVAGRTA